MEDEIKIVLTNTDLDNPVIKYYVNSKSRRAALGKYLPSSVAFGNITLINEVVEADGRISDEKSTFTDIFSNWESVSYIEKMSGWSPVLCWIVFKPTVVQYDNDNIQSPNGISTTLYEDLAREIFGKIFLMVIILVQIKYLIILQLLEYKTIIVALQPISKIVASQSRHIIRHSVTSST